MLRKIVEWLFVRIRGKENYRLPPELTNYYLFIYLKSRAFQLIRGLFFLILRKKIVFVGSSVTILAKRYLQIGKACVLEDNVHINCLSMDGIVIGNNVTIARNSTLTALGVLRHPGKGIHIGDDCSIGANSFIAGQGGIKICDNVIMGPNVQIFSENHNFHDLQLQIMEQGETRHPVLIERDCWIGAGSTILAGVIIKSGTVVSAGSVVTKSPSSGNVVIAGVPAKILKER